MNPSKNIHQSYRPSALALCLLFFLLPPFAGATGVQQLAPTAADAPVMLETGRPGFNRFAEFADSAGVVRELDNRLVVSIGGFGNETVYFGLSEEYRSSGRPFSSGQSGAASYAFQVRRILPDGTIGEVVHGPFRITRANANVSNYAEAAYPNYATTAQATVIGSTDGVLRDIYEFTPDGPGDYSIEFNDLTDLSGNDTLEQVNIPFWDFTVVRDNEVKPGRLWSRSWALRTPQQAPSPGSLPFCEWDREFNGQFYSYTDDGFVSLIDFNNAGFRGLSFTVAFNSTGPGKEGTLAERRMSVPGENATDDVGLHRVFLEEPDPELFPDGICGEATAANTFACSETGEYCLEVSVTRPGQVEVILDFNNNNVADDSLDVVLVYEFSPGDMSTCVPWDLKRGDGSDAGLTDSVNIILRYAQGVQHYSAYDVEYLENGFCVSTVRPLCTAGPDPTSRSLYWDDTDIPEEPGIMGVPKDGRAGSDCDSVPRAWSNFSTNSTSCRNVDDALTTGYGDKNTINTWWFASSSSTFIARIPTNTAVIEGETTICGDGSTVLTATDPSIAGPFTYNWSGPGQDGVGTASVTVTEAGEYRVTVTADGGCRSFGKATVVVLDENADQFADELFLCFGDTAQLATPPNPNLEYRWQPATGISDTTAPSPDFFPTATTTYTVTIRDATASELCESSEQVVVTVGEEIDLQLDGGGPICEATASFTATTAIAAELTLVAPDGSISPVGPDFTLPVSGEADYLLVATGADNCTDTVAFSLSGGPVDLELPDTVLTCLSEGVTLAAVNLDPNDELTYAWAPANLFDPATLATATPTFTAPPGAYAVSLTATNQYGCSTNEEVRVVLLDDGGTLSFTSAMGCDGATVSFTNTSTVGFGYRYDFGDGTGSTEADPVHVYETPGTYTVTLSLLYAGQDCVTPFSAPVTSLAAVLRAGIEATLEDCTDGATTVRFTDNSLNATGTDLTYAWTFTGGTPATSSAQDPSLTVTTSGTVTASLLVTSADGCQSSRDTSFAVALITDNLVGEVTICPGDSVALNPGGDPSLRYNWSPAPDFAADAPNPVTQVPGTYLVTVTAAGAALNCTKTDTVTVLGADPLGLTVSGPDGPLTGDGEFPVLTTCEASVGLSVALDVAAAAGATIVFSDLNGNELGRGDGYVVTTADRDTVVITATDAFGCQERDTVVIVNNQVNAGIDVGTQGLVFCAATDTTLSVENFDPGDVLTYAWAPSPIISGALDGPTVAITSPATGSEQLSVLVSNQLGCDTTLTVTVSAVPFTPNAYEAAVQPCYAEAITLTGGPAVPGYTYTWTPADDLDLTDPANPVGTFTEDLNLTVTITDPTTGCSDTQVIGVDVGAEISFVATPETTAACQPGPVTVTGTTPNPEAEITWFSDPELTDQLGSGPTYVVDASESDRTYTVYGRAVDPATGCGQVDTVTITVSDFTPNTFGEAVQACYQEAVTITGGPFVTGYVYAWSPSGNLDLADPANPVGTFTEDLNLTVTITDPTTGCSSTQVIGVSVAEEISFAVSPGDTAICEPGTLLVTGSTLSPAAAVTWYADAALTDSVGSGNVYALAATEVGRTYTVYARARDATTGCEQVDSVSVSLTPFTPNSYPASVLACYDEATTLGGGAAVDGYTYAWSPDGNLDLTDPANPVGTFTEDTELTVTITDPATGCTSSQTVSVTVAPEISFQVSPADTSLCEPGMVTISGSSVNNEVVITWYADADLTDSVGTGRTFPVAATELGQTYTVYGRAVDPATQCEQVLPATVRVSPLSGALPLGAVSACPGEPAEIFGDARPDAGLIYTYEPPAAVDDSDPTAPVFVGDASTILTVTVTDPATGCSTDATVDVSVIDLADLAGTADPDLILLGESATLTVTGCGGDCEYAWLPPPNGTLSADDQPTVTATPDMPGTLVYEVAVSQGGCSRIVPIELRVEDPICDAENIYVPNAFSPNGDNSNDVMRVRSRFAEELTDFRFIIYDRWGQEVYASDDIFESWDGRAEGDDLEPDVYGYWLRVLCPGGQELIQQGNITLLR